MQGHLTKDSTNGIAKNISFDIDMALWINMSDN